MYSLYLHYLLPQTWTPPHSNISRWMPITTTVRPADACTAITCVAGAHIHVLQISIHEICIVYITYSILTTLQYILYSIYTTNYKILTILYYTNYMILHYTTYIQYYTILTTTLLTILYTILITILTTPLHWLSYRDFILKLLSEDTVFEEAIMNLPANATDFLDVFIGLRSRIGPVRYILLSVW